MILDCKIKQETDLNSESANALFNANIDEEVKFLSEQCRSFETKLVPLRASEALVPDNGHLNYVNINGDLQSIESYAKLNFIDIDCGCNTNFFLFDRYFRKEDLIKPTVFVLHAFNHWLTLTNVNPNAEGTWLIYDSLNDINYIQHLTLTLRKLSPDQNTFNVQTVNAVKQKDYTDCGLFAIAYLVAIIHGKDPSKLCFDQNYMRHHFNLSLVSGI